MLSNFFYFEVLIANELNLNMIIEQSIIKSNQFNNSIFLKVFLLAKIRGTQPFNFSPEMLIKHIIFIQLHAPSKD